MRFHPRILFSLRLRKNVVRNVMKPYMPFRRNFRWLWLALENNPASLALTGSCPAGLIVAVAKHIFADLDASKKRRKPCPKERQAAYPRKIFFHDRETEGRRNLSLRRFFQNGAFVKQEKSLRPLWLTFFNRFVSEKHRDKRCVAGETTRDRM